MKRLIYLSVVILALSFASCKKGNINIFTLQDDIELGQQITEEILLNPDDYPILSEDDYPQAYEHLRRMRDEILENGGLRYADDFDWEVYIINQEVLNAFALPGGNTFYYTGLINYLDNEASFMGVMAHEFAHCDRRHSTERLTKIYGFQVLLSLILGNDPSLAAQIASDLALGLTALSFSRTDEYEADSYAVDYMYNTNTDSRGVAYFFEKMELEEGADWMIYFSTHPHPNDRIEKIYEYWETKGSKEGDLHEDRYQSFKNSLPVYDN
jgi:beta-barrel assembly-enhancing protease